MNLRTRAIEWKIDDLDMEGSNVAPPLGLGKQGLCPGLVHGLLHGCDQWQDAMETLLSPGLWTAAFHQLGHCGPKTPVEHQRALLYALHPETGAIIWENLSSEGGASSNMVAHNDVLYFTGGKLYALDIKTGQKLAEYKSPNAGRWGDANFITPIAIDSTTGYIYLDDGYYSFCLKAIK